MAWHNSLSVSTTYGEDTDAESCMDGQRRKNQSLHYTAATNSVLAGRGTVGPLMVKGENNILKTL